MAEPVLPEGVTVDQDRDTVSATTVVPAPPAEVFDFIRRPANHPIISGDTAYCSWRDAGLVIVDVPDGSNPELIVHRDGPPPFGRRRNRRREPRVIVATLGSRTVRAMRSPCQATLSLPSR